jgi:hypothetical protein
VRNIAAKIAIEWASPWIIVDRRGARAGCKRTATTAALARSTSRVDAGRFERVTLRLRALPRGNAARTEKERRGSPRHLHDALHFVVLHVSYAFSMSAFIACCA